MSIFQCGPGKKKELFPTFISYKTKSFHSLLKHSRPWMQCIVVVPPSLLFGIVWLGKSNPNVACYNNICNNDSSTPGPIGWLCFIVENIMVGHIIRNERQSKHEASSNAELSADIFILLL